MNEPYYTSDLPIAAYLCLQGYTLLGAVNAGAQDRNGNIRLDYALVWPGDMEDMKSDILKHIEVYNTEQNGSKRYYEKLRMCKRALQTPVTKQMVEYR